jgi:putative redox protein
MFKTVKIESVWKGGMRIDTTAGKHTIIVDQSESGGGKDEGANPLQIQLVALGTCLGTIAAIISRQEHLGLKGFSVDVEADIDTAYLMGKTTEGRPGFTAIRVMAHIDADMTDEEKKAFLKRVDARCPISDMLVNKTDIVFNVD